MGGLEIANKEPPLLFGSLASAKPDIPLREGAIPTILSNHNISSGEKYSYEYIQAIIGFILMYSMQAFGLKLSQLHHILHATSYLYTLRPVRLHQTPQSS